MEFIYDVILEKNNFIYWYISLIAIALFTVLTGIANFFWLKKLPENKLLNTKDLISILIPARNEEDIIESTIRSILKQNYQNFELIILNDNSTDQTKNIVEKLSMKNSQINLIDGAKLPQGWLGKNWACHQLSKQSKGKYILFIDADTQIDKNTLSDALSVIKQDNIDLLSLVPNRDTILIADNAMKKIISWFIVCWLPMKLALSLNAPFLSATFGQFMLFKKSSFNNIGGFESIKDNPVDDFQLGRNIKRNKLRWTLYDGAKRISTRTYKTNKDFISGYSKNIFPAVGYSISVFVSIFSILLSFVLFSTIPMILYLIGMEQNAEFIILSITLLILLILSWTIVTIRFNYSIVTPFSFPILISLILLLAARSFTDNMFYSSTWKDRKYKTSKKKLKF
tara:strand:- start:2371 stop:3561 length:1191 start_codon:yes stop_codon:yes gene_type:complete